MKKVGFLLCLVVFCSGCGENNKVRGAESVVHTPPLRVSDALRPMNFGRTVRVQGTVKAMCSDDNCWVALSDYANNIRVEFEENTLVPPPNLEGKNMTVEGKIVEKIISPASKGFEEYEKACGLSNSQADTRIPVIIAYRLEID